MPKMSGFRVTPPPSTLNFRNHLHPLQDFFHKGQIPFFKKFIGGRNIFFKLGTDKRTEYLIITKERIILTSASMPPYEN